MTLVAAFKAPSETCPNVSSEAVTAAFSEIQLPES
jgi:hypothetical protein